MKILDGEFRKSLYKNLVEIGYEKDDAQRIVGVKYFDALKAKVLEDISTMMGLVQENKFTEISASSEQRALDLEELIKMNDYLNKEKNS